MTTQLDEAFEKLSWNRKFKNSVPIHDILYVFRNGDNVNLKRLKEETKKVVRSAHLGSDSLGQILVICEEKWN